MADFPSIRVTIPTFNAAADIERTLDSLAAQRYQQECIFTLIVDFGSTDGTVEKILARSGKRLGLMQLPHARWGRTAAATAWKQNPLQMTSGIPLTLEQGDCLYEDALRRLVEFQRTARKYVRQPNLLVVTDVDTRLHDGSVQKSTPLYTRPCLFRAYTDDSIAFVERGGQQRMLSFGVSPLPQRDKGSTLFNQRSWWSSLSAYAMVGTIAYLPEALCIRNAEGKLDDPLDDILFRLDNVITLDRMVQDNPEVYVLGRQYDTCARRQLALYSLWRASQAAEQKAMRDAEDCFLMARVIDDTITEEPVWGELQNFFAGKPHIDLEKIAARWERCESPAEPRWPLPRNCWEEVTFRLRRLLSHDRHTALAER